MSQLDTGLARERTRVMYITFFGMLLIVGALAQAGFSTGAAPSGAGSTSSPDLLCWQAEVDTASFLYGVVAVSATDVWAVGHCAYGTLVGHWNGSDQSVVPSPNPGTADSYLKGVAAVSATDVWAVGYYEDSVNVYRTLIEHWDGTAWSIVSSPNVSTFGNWLRGVAAVSANDVWAVGYYDADGQGHDRTLTQHWDGSQWTVVPSPSPGTLYSYLEGVAAVSANDVWAVGYYDADGQGHDRTLVEHWDGTAWSVMPSPNMGITGNGLHGISAVSGSDVWAVGSYQDDSTYRTLVEHWDGTAWSVIPSPNMGTTANGLSGVAAVSATDVWAVGSYDADGQGHANTLVEHWDGTAWSLSLVSGPGSPSQSPGGYDNGNSWGNNPLVDTYSYYFWGVSAVTANDVWAVGYLYVSGHTGDYYWIIMGRISPSPSPTPTPCTAGQFSDVPPGSTFYPYVNCLVNRGIVSGYSDCSFKPNNNVRRGQLAKIVSNAAGFSDTQANQSFQDVPAGSTFFQHIGRLASLGYMGGYQCGGVNEPCVPPNNLPYFRPNNKASRGQLTKLVSNAAGFQDDIPTSVQTFADVIPTSTYWWFVERLLLNRPGVMGGYPCGGANEPCDPQQRPYFRPGNNVTRGQTSKIVANTFFPGCQTPAGPKR